MPHAGWCSRGRTAWDDPLADRYALSQSVSAGYSQRTRYNVRDSDATVNLNLGELVGGSKQTHRLALEIGRPPFVVELEGDWVPQVDPIGAWLRLNQIRCLNIAGPSESRVPGNLPLSVQLS